MKRASLVLIFCLAFCTPAVWAGTIWTHFNNTDLGTGTVTGTLGGITVTYTSTDLNPNTQINNIGTNYWYCGGSYCPVYYAPGITPPDTVDMISINGSAVAHTITFSSPVTNPVMALISLGQPNVFTTYYFDQPFTILTSGGGWWGGGSLNLVSGNGLEGIEGDGLVQFNGTFSQITWTGANPEYWNGFNVGATPEPGTLALLGTSVVGLAGVLRRKLGK